MKLLIAKDGCGSTKTFCGKVIYYSYDQDITPEFIRSILGNSQYKNGWIKENVNSQSNIETIQNLLADWELYEKGWFIGNSSNTHLFYYLCQIGGWGSLKPNELDYINLNNH